MDSDEKKLLKKDITVKINDKLQEIENLEKIMDENQQKMRSLEQESEEIEQEKEKIMEMMMGIQ